MFKKWKPEDRAAAKKAITSLWQVEYNTSTTVPAHTPLMRSPKSAFELWEAEIFAAEEAAMALD